MTTVNQELALAASRVRILGEHLSASEQANIASDWGRLLDDIDECLSDGGRIATILEFRERFESRVSRQPIPSTGS